MAATSAGRLSSPARTPPAVSRSLRSATSPTLQAARTRDRHRRRRAPAPGASYAGTVTAAALTSTDAAVATLRTVEIPTAASLLELLPDDAALSWVRRGEGLVGWGETA